MPLDLKSFAALRGSLLDVRAVGEPPIKGAVHIPFRELASRIHELPVGPIAVADAGSVDEATAWLQRGGRVVTVVGDFGYAENPPGLRLWQPTPFLMECLGGPPGRALELACGSGRDAVALASLGWDVVGVDHLSDALSRAKDMERRYAPIDAKPIEWRLADLESGFELHEQFDLISMFRYLDRGVLGRVRDWLRPGGSLVVETFTTTHRDRYGKPRHESHVLQPGELPTLVDLDVVTYIEAWHGEIHTARMHAVKKQRRTL